MQIDQIIYQKTENIHSATLDVFFNSITALGRWEIVLLFIVLLSIHFLHKRELKWLFAMYLSNTLAMLISFTTKIAVARPRPENDLLLQNNFSFPSGHATIASVFYTFIFYYIYKKTENKILKKVIIAVAGLIVLLVCYSRIYLQVHYFTDVVAGFIVGFSSFLIARKIIKI